MSISMNCTQDDKSSYAVVEFWEAHCYRFPSRRLSGLGMPLSAVQVIFLLYAVVATFSFPTAAKNLLLKMIGIYPRWKHQPRLRVFPRQGDRTLGTRQP